MYFAKNENCVTLATMCPPLRGLFSMTSCSPAAHWCFYFTARVLYSVSSNEANPARKVGATWNGRLPRHCLCVLTSWFHSPHSCFLHRRAWISTRWWESSVKWRSFWKARRCASQRASGSWNQSWQCFRTLSPRCLRQISQLVSNKQITQKPSTNKSHQSCVLVFV